MSENQETNPQIEIDPETGFVNEGSGAAATPGPDWESLTQVRNILVGPMSRDLEEGLANLERRLDQSVRELTESTTGRLDALEKRLREDVDDLKTSLGEQDTSHSEQLQQAKTEHESIVAELREQTEDLSKQIPSAQAEVHDQLIREVQNVKDEIERLGVKLAADLSGEAGRLREELVDRASLASSLSEVVLRVSGPAGVMGVHPSESELDELLDGHAED